MIMETPHGYKVGQQEFSNKLNAIYYASATNQDVEWNFYNDQYSKYDWTVEPDQTLDQLYKQRAQELREQFDYIVVLASGGADSRNVVYSFLKNGIKIDEIIGSVPLEGAKNYDFNDRDTSHRNTVSETVFAQLPFLEEIRKDYTQQKITIHDYFQDLVDFQTDDWLIRCGEWLHPSSAARYSFDRLTHLKKVAESGKKVAFIYGIDKPLVFTTVVGGVKRAHALLSDLPLNVMRPPFKEDFENVHNIPFYLGPDPAISIKQCHILRREVLAPNIAIASLFKPWPEDPNLSSLDKRKRHSKYERAIIPFIYPETYRPIFQAEKPENIFLGEHDDWLYKLHKRTRMVELIKVDTQLFSRSIKDKYFNIDNTGFKNGFKTFTKSYFVGNY